MTKQSTHISCDEAGLTSNAPARSSSALFVYVAHDLSVETNQHDRPQVASSLNANCNALWTRAATLLWLPRTQHFRLQG